jgi:RHS repeat-associated protein
MLDANGATQPYGHAPLVAYNNLAAPVFETILNNPAAALQNAATFLWYDLAAWTASASPPRVIRLVQQDYLQNGSGAQQTLGVPQVRVTYFDGFSRKLQSKLRAEAGEAVARDGAGNLVLQGGQPTEAPAAQRWLVDGHVVFNRKQQVVRQYEPFFTPTAAFEPENILSQYGVSQVTHYDGLGRRLREDFPNGTYATFQFLPWKTTTWDANDNILTSDYRTQRNLLPNTDPEKQALLQTEAHAGTPNISILGPRGMAVRDIHTAAAGGTDLQTNRELDCLDEVLSITDARGIVACRYVKDMTARDLATAAADHGMIQMLPDIYGRIVHQWDARGVHQQRTYDALDRLVSVHVDGALGLNHTVEQRVYGEAGTIANAQLRNLRGQLALHRDSAGVTVYGQFDLKGDLLRSSRQFRTDYKNEANWDDATTVALDPTTYATTTVLDALRRETRQILPDGTTRSIGYLQGGGIVSSQITTPDGSLTNKALLSGMVYNARSQRLSAVYGNGVTVTHAYDPATFRTASIQVQGAAALMDLRYTYDPVGNITWSSDHAQAPPVPGPFLQGINVSPDQAFVYDEFYQLTQATGRVHQSLLQYDFAPGNTTAGWVKGTRHLSLNNGTAVERYTRRYTYDLGGNLTRIRHEGTTSTWNMNMWIAADSNRGLLSTDPDGTAVTNPAQAFDAAGNCLALPNLARVEWNYRGGIAKAVSIDRGGHDPDDAEYYVYDAQGLRVRRVTERLNSGKVDKLERIYLDGCDITRRSLGVTQHLERFTSHVLDGSHRAALVHRWTMDDLALETDDITRLRVRYQLTNHLGSSLMELDENAALITYEEYFPFGGTAFLAGDQDREIAMRDYRFCGKENDDFTGLYYCAARYYAPWMGRWMSADPAGPEDVLNLFCYCRNNPVAFSDPEGLQPESGQVNHIAVTSIPDNIRSRLTASQLRQIEGGGYGWWVKGHTLEVLPNDEVNRRAAAEARRTRQAVTLHDVTGSSNSEGPGTGTASATAGNRPSATPPSPATDGASTTRATGTTGATDPSSPTPQQNNASGAEQNSSHEPPNYSQQPVRSEQSGGGASAGTSSDGATATGGPNGDPNGGSASDPNGVPGQTAAGTQSQSNGSPGQPGNTDGPPGGTNPNGSVDGHPGGDPSGDGTPEDTGTDIDWGTVALSAGKTLLVGAAVILAGAALVAAGIISAPFLAVVGVLALIGIGLHAFFKRANEALDNGQTDRTGQAGLAALGDTVGVTGIYEGATGHDAVTDRTLHTQERSDRLGTGIGSVATVLSASRISRLGTSLGRSGLTASGYSLYDVPSISRPTVRNPLVSGTYQSPEGMLWRANMSNGVRAGWSSWRGGRGFWMGFEGRGGQAVPGAYRGGAGNFWHVRSHFFDIPGRPTHSIFSPDLGQHLVLLGDAPGIAARGANVTVGRLVVEPGSVLPLQSMYPRPNGNPGWFVGTQPPQMPQIGIVGGQAPNAGDPLNFGYRVVTRPGPTAGTNVPVTMYPE